MSYEPKKMAPNKKWEKLFKKFFKQNTDTPTDQWAMPNRRFTELPDDLILPSEYEQEDKDFDKVSIWLFLDVSGSCIGFKDRFIDIYETIPKKKFKVRLFSFDTNCKEVDTKTKQIYGGGGTSFVPIEQRIQFICRTEKLSYPKLIVVFTDGESFDYVKPEYPERWHWFLMDSNSNFYYPASHQKSLYTSQIPKGSVVYDLSEYESK
jgi:predicted metal-dependent peptidase